MIRYIVILVLIYNVSCENLMLSQGSLCEWDGIPGRCVSVYQCVTAGFDIANKTNPPVCSFEGKLPIICCTDCKLVKDSRLLVRNKYLGILVKTGTVKAKDKCVDYIHTLAYKCKDGLLPVPTTKKKLDTNKNCTYEGSDSIQASYYTIGGRNALREEFPHMALLGFGKTIDTAQWRCGGSVISERFILTAAHCVFSRSLGQVKFIALGLLKRSDPPSLWEIYNVQRAITHPDYNPPFKYHDIALLQTDREIAFSSKVLPACLHVDDKVDSLASAAGWGALGYKEDLSDVLQSVLLRKYTDEECSERYPEHRLLARGFDTSIQMCYGDTEKQPGPTDTCEGDSGGPLHSQDHEQCVYTVLGVTSYGRPCGGAAGAGIYTRVRSYVPWIEEIVWP